MARTKSIGTNTSSATIGLETALRGSAIFQSTAMLRSLSKAMDNRFLPIYEFVDKMKVIAITSNRNDLALAA